MRKYMRDIEVGVVASIVVIVVVGFVSGHEKNRDNEVTAKLETLLRTELGQISQQIKAEQKHRCQLAAALLKSGVDLPTDCLVGYSCAPHDGQSNKMLLAALSQRALPLDREDDYVAFLDQMKGKGAIYPAITRLGTDTYLLSSLNTKPAGSSGAAGQCVAEVRLQNRDTQDRLSELKATYFSSAMDLLRQPGITTGSLKTIHVKSIIKPPDPNRPREKTH